MLYLALHTVKNCIVEIDLQSLSHRLKTYPQIMSFKYQIRDGTKG